MKLNIKRWLTASKSLETHAETPDWLGTESANESPIKAELFSAAQMERYGQKLARSLMLCENLAHKGSTSYLFVLNGYF